MAHQLFRGSDIDDRAPRAWPGTKRGRVSGAKSVAAYVERIARSIPLPIPDGFRWLSYVQGKYCDMGGNNIRACIDLLPDALRRFKGRAKDALCRDAAAA